VWTGFQVFNKDEWMVNAMPVTAHGSGQDESLQVPIASTSAILEFASKALGLQETACGLVDRKKRLEDAIRARESSYKREAKL